MPVRSFFIYQVHGCVGIKVVLLRHVALNTIICVCVGVCYRSLQQHCRVQSDLQLDDSLSAHLQVTDITHQTLAQLVFTSAELHTWKQLDRRGYGRCKRRRAHSQPVRIIVLIKTLF